MDLLILGGTKFVGRHITQTALDAGERENRMANCETQIMYKELELKETELNHELTL